MMRALRSVVLASSVLLNVFLATSRQEMNKSYEDVIARVLNNTLKDLRIR
jgi:hypothetical protein